MPIAKEQLRQIIVDNDITNVGDIYSLFKECRNRNMDNTCKGGHLELKKILYYFNLDFHRLGQRVKSKNGGAAA